MKIYNEIILQWNGDTQKFETIYEDSFNYSGNVMELQDGGDIPPAPDTPPNTDDHDFNFKLKHAIKFLENGAKVKAYVHFYGRTIVFKERGEILLLKLAHALEDYANVEELPKLEGKRMFLMLSPKK